MRRGHADAASLPRDLDTLGSVATLAGVSLATDRVFADGATLETPSVSGSANAGYAALTVGVVP